MMIESIQLSNILSFGPSCPELELRPLNVLIGPNGSGKSNLIDAIALLRATTTDLGGWVSDNGGVRNWMWKGDTVGPPQVMTTVKKARFNKVLRHLLAFRLEGQRLHMADERVENALPSKGHDEPYFYYRYQNGSPVLSVVEEKDELKRVEIESDRSILSERRDSDRYPEVTYLAKNYGAIRIYREWSFGRTSAMRVPQPADQRNDFLAEDFRNLGLVLSQLRRDPPTKRLLLQHLRDLYPSLDDFEINVEGGTVQIFLQEGDFAIPATRLSDGTLRFLCLLAVLCHPKPPPLICMEEPELGLHPDILPKLAELLVAASEKTQLIVTTHSDVLVDALSDTPESIVVCEKQKDSTVMKRLDGEALAEWLKEYSLGTLWRMGEIGGNRW